MFPLPRLVLPFLLAAALPALAQSTQQLLSEAQTAYIRGDLPTAKRDFEEVRRLDPKNTLAINYLRMIQATEAQKPKGSDLEKRMAAVILPKFEVKEATLAEALDFLRQAVDKASEGKAGLSFVVQLPEEQKAQAITLSLRGAPVSEVLRYIGGLANVQFEYDKYAVVVKPKAAATTATAQ